MGTAIVTTVGMMSLMIMQNLVRALPSSTFQGIGRSIQSLSSNEVAEPFNLTGKIEQVLEEQRNSIDVELTGYDFPANNDSATTVDDFVPERGGRPLRNIIVTTWRSGSTFLGDILNSVPANFYHYEPLLDHGIVQVRGPPLANLSLKYIRQLLNCNYSDMENYLTYGQDHNWLFSHNTRLWDKCLATPQICFVPQFLTKFCSLFPFQSMKLVRMRLSLMEDILADTNLGAKVLLVVRDPRGTIQSRKHRDWCPGNPDCSEPQRLCSDLVADYSAALKFQKKFPNTFRAVRYEDISLDPYNETKRLFKFFGLQFHPAVRLFLGTHTNKNYGGVSSTYRNSSSAPFHWRSDLSYAEVVNIQNKCKAAMSAWGYLKALNSSHVKKFNPINRKFTLQ